MVDHLEAMALEFEVRVIEVVKKKKCGGRRQSAKRRQEFAEINCKIASSDGRRSRHVKCLESTGS
jgi:hypothetical protein